MNEKRLIKKFQELSDRVNKFYNYGGMHGALSCDAYRRVINELGKQAVPLILDEISLKKHYYWFTALEKINNIIIKDNNVENKIKEWIKWWENNKDPN